MGYATTTTGHVGETDRTKERRYLKSEVVNGTFVNVFQDVQTSTDVYRGLSKTDAESLCTSSSSSTLGSTTRNYLGGVRVTVGSGTSSTWFTLYGCWGTEISSKMVKDGDSHLYDVVRTARTMNITVPTPSGSGITATLL